MPYHTIAKKFYFSQAGDGYASWQRQVHPFRKYGILLEWRNKNYLLNDNLVVNANYYHHIMLFEVIFLY